MSEFMWNKRDFAAMTVQNGRQAKVSVCHKDVVSNPKDFMVDTSITIAICAIAQELMAIEETRRKLGKGDKPITDKPKEAEDTKVVVSTTKKKLEEQLKDIESLLAEKEFLKEISGSITKLVSETKFPKKGLSTKVRTNVIERITRTINERIKELEA